MVYPIEGLEREVADNPKVMYFPMLLPKMDFN
jgi:hypothetical protein